LRIAPRDYAVHIEDGFFLDLGNNIGGFVIEGIYVHSERAAVPGKGMAVATRGKVLEDYRRRVFTADVR
jgi:hypothetical protein